jgi:hypothetical protein
MASCRHCSSTTFVCDCGAWVVVAQVIESIHVGECERCGKIVDNACIYRGIADTPARSKGIVRRSRKRLAGNR